MNPLHNTGFLLQRESRGVRGSCFVFRYPNRFLTAAHCVDGAAPADLAVFLPSAGTAFEVAAVIPHPTADLAVLHVPDVQENHITWPHYLVFDDRAWGVDFASCGYVDVSDPTLRVFRGHVQRFFNHSSHMGYRYVAAELSIGCPVGLSGAPLFNSTHMGRLYGVVAENIRTETEVETVLEVEKGNVINREKMARVIHYGLAVWLHDVLGWLDQLVTPVSDEEYNRRAANQQRLIAQERHRSSPAHD
jgi:trypsin-like peptidase